MTSNKIPNSRYLELFGQMNQIEPFPVIFASSAKKGRIQMFAAIKTGHSETKN